MAWRPITAGGHCADSRGGAEYCQASPVTLCCRVESWKMLSQEFPTMNVARLQALYSSVDDIDVFIGGILEPAVNGSLLGPTFLCIIGDQFQRIRWYRALAH